MPTTVNKEASDTAYRYTGRVALRVIVPDFSGAVDGGSGVERLMDMDS
jgi:hypothetical protein